MATTGPEQPAGILAVPTATLGEAPEGFDAVHSFLQRFGYLDDERAASLTSGLDDVTSSALALYQEFHGLTPTGLFDEDTREMMSRPRCALADRPDAGPAFTIACAWNKNALTYAFDAGTADIAGDTERAAIRTAFATWSAAVQISFREVGTGDSPDIRIGWTNANCGDADMSGGTLAHADYPSGCGFYGNAIPRPLHINDQQYTWCIGAVAGQYDVETVALHEIGHIVGLQHSTIAAAVMFPTIGDGRTNRALNPDDLEGVRRLYPIMGPIFSRHSGKCIDIQGTATGNGADATQWEYWGGQNQIFRIEWVEAAHYRLIAQHSGRVLDVEGQSTANGALIHQWDWWGGNNQKFRLDPLGHGYYRLVARHTGKVADVQAASANNGAKIIQWDWWGGNNQQWRLGPAPISSQHSGKVLDIAGGSTANGALVHQWDYWGGGNQRFRLDPVGGGFYRIMIEHTGKCIDIEGVSTANGARAIQWEYWGGGNQKFKPEPLPGGYYKLIAQHSGKALDVSNWSTANGGQILQWDVHNGNNQKWRL